MPLTLTNPHPTLTTPSPTLTQPSPTKSTRGRKHLQHALPDAARCITSLLPDAAGYTPIALLDNATRAQHFCRILAPGLGNTQLTVQSVSVPVGTSGCTQWWRVAVAGQGVYFLSSRFFVCIFACPIPHSPFIA